MLDCAVYSYVSATHPKYGGWLFIKFSSVLSIDVFLKAVKFASINSSFMKCCYGAFSVYTNIYIYILQCKIIFKSEWHSAVFPHEMKCSVMWHIWNNIQWQNECKWWQNDTRESVHTYTHTTHEHWSLCVHDPQWVSTVLLRVSVHTHCEYTNDGSVYCVHDVVSLSSACWPRRVWGQVWGWMKGC